MFLLYIYIGNNICSLLRFQIYLSLPATYFESYKTVIVTCHVSLLISEKSILWISKKIKGI